MEQKTERIIDIADLEVISNNKFELRLEKCNLLVSTQLVEVLTPNCSAFIISFIKEDKLDLIESLATFFKNLKLNEKIYIQFKLEIAFTELSITEIYFSQNSDFNDLKIEMPTIITDTVIKSVIEAMSPQYID